MKTGSAICLLLYLTAVVSLRAELPPSAFFEKHCYACHDAELKKGGLDLTVLKAEFGDANFDIWVKIHDLVASGEMPPAKKKKRPSQPEIEGLVTWTHQQLMDAEARKGSDRAVVRRLTRLEYENAVRDVLGLQYLDIREMLPEDGTRHGYDKIGAALDLSHVQLARYMDAADVALDLAVATRPTPPPCMKRRIYPAEGSNFTKMVGCGNGVLLSDFAPDPLWPVPGQLVGKEYQDSYVAAVNAGLPLSKSAMGLFHPNDNYMQTSYVFSPLFYGKYRLRISLWSFMWNAGRVDPSPKTEVAMLHVGPRTLGYFDAPSLKPLVSEITPWLFPGNQVFFDPASIFNHNKQVRQGVGGGAAYVGPGIATDWMEVEGPIYETWPPESHKRVFGDLPIQPFDPDAGVNPPHRQPLRPERRSWPQVINFPQEDQNPGLFSVVSAQPLIDAARLLKPFLARAFRRPVTDTEVQNYVKCVKARLDDNDCFESAIRYACKAALTSTNFLFRIETAAKLDDFALASRLSFWLWNSAPDDELLKVAGTGKLSQPEVLHAQVERMLADAKSESFIVDFLDQWLRLRDINSTDPDSQLYPDFHLYLKESMLEESRAFLRELVKNDLSATNIISSDFLMLNERLAEHYLFLGVEGSRVRRVAITPDCERGGFISQGSVLKVTANGTVTSPVIRGIWMNERILGIHVPPPPPGTPAIDPDTRGATTIREQLVSHRADPKCAACHAKIDPCGFALECFDVIGGMRSSYRSLGAGEATNRVFPGGWRPQYKLGPAVETDGVLPDGHKFKDIIGLRNHLLEHPDHIARNFVHQIITYATGAEPTYRDRAALTKVVESTKSRNYGIRSLIHAVTQSEVFQNK